MEPSARRSPRRSAGMTPARTSDDFPLPEAPMMARKRVLFRRLTILATSASRPKKRDASFSSKTCMPWNGASPGSGGRFSMSLTSALLTIVDLMLMTAPRKSPERSYRSPDGGSAGLGGFSAGSGAPAMCVRGRGELVPDHASDGFDDLAGQRQHQRCDLGEI